FSIAPSLAVIATVLLVTITASMLSHRGRVMSVVRTLDRYAHAYLHTEYSGTDEQRAAEYEQILKAEQTLEGMDQDLVQDLLRETGANHAAAAAHALHAKSN
ncbi:MAG: TerC family protein, partial [Arachnia sp.]